MIREKGVNSGGILERDLRVRPHLGPGTCSLTTRNPDDEANQNKGGSEIQNKEPGAGN